MPLTIAKNDAAFKAFVDKNVAIANQVATDATISADDGEAVITPDKAGWTYSVPGGNQNCRCRSSLVALKRQPYKNNCDASTHGQ